MYGLNFSSGFNLSILARHGNATLRINIGKLVICVNCTG